MDVEDELSIELAKQIQEMVDVEVLIKLFKSMGWTEQVSVMPNVMDDWDYTGIFKGGSWHDKARTIWIFENEEDLTYFVLKWSEYIESTTDSWVLK